MLPDPDMLFSADNLQVFSVGPLACLYAIDIIDISNSSLRQKHFDKLTRTAF
jgi:phosphoribosyl-dephospho-CoA transferase